MISYYNQEACENWKKGHLALTNKNFAQARTFLEQARSAFFKDIQNLPQPWDDAPYIHNITSYFKVTIEIGFLLNQTDDHTAALSFYDETLQYARKMHEKHSEALFLVLALNGLGFSLFCLSRFQSALAHFSEGYLLAEKLGTSFDKAYFLIQQAAVLERLGRGAEAGDKLNSASSILASNLQAKLQPDFILPLSGPDFITIIKSDAELRKLWVSFTDKLTNLGFKESVEIAKNLL